MFTHRRLAANPGARHVFSMIRNNPGWPPRPPRTDTDQDGPVLDMTPAGDFVEAPNAPFLTPFATRALGIAIVVAVLAGLAALAFLALWIAIQLIPIAIGAGLVAYGVLRFQTWRARRASLGGQGHGLRR